jgi:GNAT superfamily N-acetyltransferase
MSYDVDDDKARVDLDVVWKFLSTDAYWGTWRGREQVEDQVGSAWRVVGAYEAGTGRMVGFARAISDGQAIAYLADVFVTDDARVHGVGKALVRKMIDEGPGTGFRWMLHTRDAHGLYAQFGFQTPNETFLERPAAG